MPKFLKYSPIKYQVDWNFRFSTGKNAVFACFSSDLPLFGMMPEKSGMALVAWQGRASALFCATDGSSRCIEWQILSFYACLSK